MKKIVACVICILLTSFVAFARDALTADLRLSLLLGGTWVNGATELNSKSVDYKTNWQPFGAQEACDFFIHGFFIGIHEEIGLGVANLNTKDFKTVGTYTFDGSDWSAHYGYRNTLWFIHVGPVFALRPAKVISFHIAPLFGFEQMWRTSAVIESNWTYRIKSESDYTHGFSVGADLYTRLRFNRFLIVGGIKALFLPFPEIISTSSALFGQNMGEVTAKPAFSVKGHLGFGIEIGERL